MRGVVLARDQDFKSAIGLQFSAVGVTVLPQHLVERMRLAKEQEEHLLTGLQGISGGSM
jgi:hypothetical protein